MGEVIRKIFSIEKKNIPYKGIKPKAADRSLSGPSFADQDVQKAAMALVHQSSTLVLATADETGPWSAPVYYVWLKGRFFFFSSPDSRHIRQALHTPKTAAAVYHSSESVKEIRGLQMEGRLMRISSPLLSLEVIRRYVDRYPFVRPFFSNLNTPDAGDFFSRFKARLYGFVPETVVYTDNRFGFGTRSSITLT